MSKVTRNKGFTESRRTRRTYLEKLFGVVRGKSVPYKGSMRLCVDGSYPCFKHGVDHAGCIYYGGS